MAQRPTSRGMYQLVWLGALLLFAGVIALALGIQARRGAGTIDPASVQVDTFPVKQPDEPTIAERIGPLRLDLDKAQFSLSSGDGELKMRVWAEKAVKDGTRFTIDEGALQFTLKDHNALLLRVSKASYRLDAGVATVQGTLIGSILGTGQYFSAEELSWDQAGHQVRAKRVYYTGPHVEVHGEQMNIDLDTGKVSFEGPVEGAI